MTSLEGKLLFSQRVAQVLAVAAVALSTLSCAADTRNGSQVSATGAKGDTLSRRYAQGTVGAAVNDYFFAMDGVQRWYGVQMGMWPYVQSHPQYHSRMNFELNHPLQEYISQVESDSLIHGTLQRVRMSSREYVLLTTYMALGRMAVHLADSLGAAGRVEGADSLVAFFRYHKREIDSLDSQFPKDEAR